ncbi:MAG TPA: DUF4124 domain-containing protein [Steroidobacteraceae bacterium]|nr:DUF4124 domain-containing protein [Steroidobacteraceae bacterium]
MRRSLIAVLLIALPLTAALADVYRSVDAQGHVQYSDMPSPGAVLISSADLSADADPEDASAAAKNAAAVEKAGDEASQRVAREEAERAVERDTAAAHAQQCKQAQDAYQKAIAARRIYTVDANGNRQYLSDAQADQQRLQYRMAMQAACQDADSQ